MRNGISIVLCCVLLFFEAEAQVIGPTDFFGVNLERDGAVAELHRLAQMGKVVAEGRVVAEYNDGLETDFDMSGGRVVSATVKEGSLAEVMESWLYYDSVFVPPFAYVDTYVSREWAPVADGRYRFSRVSFYRCGDYSVSLQVHMESPTKSDADVDRACLVVGLGVLANK